MAGLLILATVSSYLVGWLIGWPVLVPILNTAASYPFMVASLRRGNLHRAIGWMLIWGLVMAVCATAMSYRWPAATDRLFVGASAYRVEMQAWVLTGVGAESTPSVFLPQHVWHAAVFSLLALATGGALAMPMGAVLINYMGHYVGTLAAAGAHPGALLILGWHPWAIIRVISFVVIGVVLSTPVVIRTSPRSARRAAGLGRRDRWRLLGWAGVGLVVDAVLKTLLAPAWQRLLLRLLS